MCTGIQIPSPQGPVLGRSMDIQGPVDYNIIYFPKGYPIAEDLLGGHFVSDYACVGVGFRNQDPLKDGINERGLVGIINEYFVNHLFADRVDPDQTNLSSFYYLNYALGKYASVAELVEDLPNIHLAKEDHQGRQVICPDFHYMFTDVTGACVVLEPHEGRLICHANPYQVMTNAPDFSYHIKKLKQTFNLDDLASFKGAKKLPGGYDPSSRFIKAFYLSAMSLPAESTDQALGQCYTILDAVQLPKGFIPNKSHHYYTFTSYIAVYDTAKKRLTLKSHSNPTVYEALLEDLVTGSDRQAIFLDLDFNAVNLLRG